MRYISTRDNYISYSFSEILMRGMAPDGGLFVPQDWPSLSVEQWRALQGKPYHEIAFAVMRLFIDDTVAQTELKDAIEESYLNHVKPDSMSSFRHNDIAPLYNLGNNKYVMELFHGPTLAFKDIALQFLGRLFDIVLKKEHKHITIIGATSGDTGSAAIEGCKDCKNARIFILHPHGHTSDVQRRQMTTVLSDNVHNIALEGTFDDCQNIVKELFADTALNQTHNFTAINSINWARIMAQIVYYVSTALHLGAPDKGIEFTVPTGNFGNMFAAFAAKKMGIPIHRLVIASNENDILTRFIHTGRLETTSVHHTFSPSMDIQISSNFERYLFEHFTRNEDDLTGFMNRFKTKGIALTSKKNIDPLFAAYRVSDDDTLRTIKHVYEQYGYLLDPHSAVGFSAMEDALEDGILSEGVAKVILACAHPAKFPDAVQKATGIKPELPNTLADLFEREERYHVLPNDYASVVDFINSH